MSMTSVSLSCAIRPARSGGSSGGAAARAAAACRGGGGVHNTFGAGAVPATPRTPGVPQPSSSPEAATPRVTGSNAREAGTLRPGTSGGRVAYRASIVLCAKGLGRGRGSHYTHTPRRSWTIPCREERRHVGRVTRAARSVAVGSAFLQDPRARGRGHPAAAAALYVEDAEGKRLRERLAEQLRVAPSLRYEGKGRPTKKERREIDQLRGE